MDQTDQSTHDAPPPSEAMAAGGELELALGLPSPVEAAPIQIELLPPDPKLTQPELALVPEPPKPAEPPPLSPKAQLAEFDRIHAGKPVSEFSRRNREILVMRAEMDPIEKIARVKQCPVPTIKWVLKMARHRKFDRLVEKARAGRQGKRQQILAALRSGKPPREVERQFGSHRTTILRARHQLETNTAAA